MHSDYYTGCGNYSSRKTRIVIIILDVVTTVVVRHACNYSSRKTCIVIIILDVVTTVVVRHA